MRRDLVTSFPEKSTREVVAIEKEFYHWFCDYFLESIKLLSISDKELNRRLRIKNPEVHEQWYLKGRNTAGFLGHYCNWEWLSRAGKDMKGLKIGIMGCIVNGPGEMADADYGYVGAGPGKISLYKGKECVEHNIPEGEAVERLLRLIKTDRPEIGNK